MIVFWLFRAKARFEARSLAYMLMFQAASLA